MAMCPLAVDWGNVADWAAVVVAIAGAVAVVFVTKAANRTARASHELAKQLKERDEETRLRDRTVLIALIYGEILGAKSHYEELLEQLAAEGGFQWAVESEERIAFVENLAKGSALSRTKESTHRLNLLPTKLGEQIAMGIGMTDLCGIIAQDLRHAQDRRSQKDAFNRLLDGVDAASRAFASAHHEMTVLLPGK